MSDDNNQKSRGPRKGGGTGGRGGGFGGKGPGSKGPGSGRSRAGGEGKPFRGRSEGGERPARSFGKPEFGKPEGRPPFRERNGEERPRREGGERPFRARTEGERSTSRPPREGFAPRGERAGGKSFGGKGFGGNGSGGKDFDRPRAERPRRARDEAPASEAKLLPSLIPEPERIAKVMARAGVASRRDCEAMIAEGRVSVNGTVLESPALDVGPDDVVLVDGEPLPARERTRMWLYHKPRGLVTTNHDPEGRPTVFDALPEDLPRVLSIGRLDINTEGLLLLTNDGGLARMLELPETGWLRRYRVRAFGSVTQDKLDTLRDGVTIEGVHYGPVVARFERQQGSNTWLTVDLREGKNREVKTVLEHLGLDVNRLIRVSFGPFQLGDLPEGEVDELRSRVLKDQLGEELMAKAGVDFEAPRRDELPAAPPRPRAPAGDDRPRRRSAEDHDGKPERERWQSDVVRTPSRDDRSDKPWKRTVWRDAEAEPQRERKAPPRRGADPKIERQARETSGEVVRRRDKAIADPSGRRVLVERVSAAPREEPREARAPREGRMSREDAPSKRRPDRLPRSGSEGRSARTQDRNGSERPMRAPRGDRPERAPREGGERPPRRFSERPSEERGGDRRPARGFGDKPGEGGKRFGGRSDERPAGRSGSKPFGGKPGGGRPFGGKPGGGRPGGGKGPRPGGRRD